MSERPAIATNPRRVEKNTLRGFFDLELASGLVLKGCALHLSHGKYWIGLPARPFETPEGAKSWAPVVDFRDRSTKDKFQALALAAAAEHFPEIEKQEEAAR